MTKNVSTKTIIKIAKEASSLIGLEIKRKAHFGGIGREIKGAIGKGGDLSKQGDLIAEKVMFKYLSKLIKSNVIDQVILISEESGIREFNSNTKKKVERSIFIILDPVDGSNNMRPWRTPRAFVGCSLALGRTSYLKQDPTISAVEVGWVRDIFYELDYYAVRGQGSFFKSRDLKRPVKLITGKMKILSDSIIAVSLDKSLEKFDKINAKLESVLRNKKCQRRLGSTVLDLSKVACGEFDAFISVSGNIKIHDIAAMKLIIEEAGGSFWFHQVRGLENKNYLRELILERKDNFIKDVGFEVIATGTKSLLKDIQKFLK